MTQYSQSGVKILQSMGTMIKVVVGWVFVVVWFQKRKFQSLAMLLRLVLNTGFTRSSHLSI